tara:strand:+ start:248 stop:448 length:201 start_codon:yes stop_codon:yes gene_type:complete
MKKIGFLFLISFLFFFIAQVVWTITLFLELPLFGSNFLEDLFVGSLFSACSVFGLIASIKLYNKGD